jgi:nucleotide-binding universal stress UspA family protein
VAKEPKPIVVPLDGSKNAELALPAAEALSRLYDAPIAFVHALHGEYVESAADRAAAEKIFADYVASLASSRAIDASSYTSAVIEGPPAEGVLRFAEHALFIVLASHGRGGVRAAIMGSVADKIVRGSEIPIVLVPVSGTGTALDQRPILVAVDGSKEAEEGLRLAREIAARAKRGLALLRAYDTAPPIYVDFAFYPADFAGTLEEAARDYVKGVGLPGETTLVAQGRADAAIEEAAESIDAGLVVMTTQGMGLAKRIALGSTTDRVMRSLKRPLLIVPAGSGAPATSNKNLAGAAKG